MASISRSKVSDVVQVALIARGSRVYTISLNDFTSGGDTALLEQLLSTLTIDEPEK